MTHIEELGKLFDDFAKLFDQLSVIQQEKVQATNQDDLQALDHCLQREQALSLQLRGMQRKKDQISNTLGLGSIPLRKIPDCLSPADRAIIAPAMNKFRAAYELYSSAAAASRAVLETTLQEIEHALDEASKDTPHAQAPKQQGSFTDIKA